MEKRRGPRLSFFFRFSFGARIDDSFSRSISKRIKNNFFSFSFPFLTWSSSLPGTFAMASITPRTSLAVLALGSAANSGLSSSNSAASAEASPSATSASMSAETAASRARVASTSAAEGAAVLLAAFAEEEAEVSRPRRASARRVAMRASEVEEVISMLFFLSFKVEEEVKKRKRELKKREIKKRKRKRRSKRATSSPRFLALSFSLSPSRVQSSVSFPLPHRDEDRHVRCRWHLRSSDQVSREQGRTRGLNCLSSSPLVSKDKTFSSSSFYPSSPFSPLDSYFLLPLHPLAPLQGRR